ncbi:MAG TPA: membrane-bound lytic murein transglycosylase MltF [Steroidobacteraceae bacterium]|jgi:membrane-bound lytic murein transglycosylase F|nr:membrane-bound lytic murein transglycosylase MltF [Steroidobacteraceae bacterium]
MSRLSTMESFYRFYKGRQVTRCVMAGVAMMVLVASSYSPAPRSVNPVWGKGELRVVTLEGPTTYTKGTRGTEGLEFRLAQAFARQQGLALYIYPVASPALMRAELAAGRADIAAAQLTADASWAAVGDAAAVYDHVPQLVVYRRGEEPPSAQDLGSLQLLVRADSPQEAMLRRLKIRVYPKLAWTAVSPHAVDPVQDIQNGAGDYAVVDANEYAYARHLYPDVVPAFSLPEPRPVQWVVRHTDPDLYAAVNTFIAGAQQSGLLGALLMPPPQDRRVLAYEDTRQFHHDLDARLPQYRAWFEEASEQTGIDWRLLAAIGYQESKWDPEAQSPMGASGMMMLTSNTADSLGVEDRSDARENILAGARYFQEVRAKVPAHIPEPDRTWLAIAAYNVGYGHVEDARRLAQMRGKNPDSWQDVRDQLPLLADETWYDRLKHGFARGTEPAQFVDHIQRFLKLLEWQPGNVTKVPPASTNPDATWVGRPAA